MKRKLISQNKQRISKWLKSKPSKVFLHHTDNTSSFDKITKIKRLGQICYERRIKILNKLNPRRLKKLRQKQQKSGLAGSRFPGMCKIPLKPASAPFRIQSQP